MITPQGCVPRAVNLAPIPKIVKAKTVVKTVVKHHRTAVRVLIFTSILVVLVITHESSVSLAALAYKALEMFGDVVADRVFPAEWFDEGSN